MALSDVWRDISSYIKIYTGTNFDDVPISPGIYAWYYPIKMPTSMKIDDLAEELSSILNYDSELKREQEKSGEIEFNWKKVEVNLIEKNVKKFPKKTYDHWSKLKNNTKFVNDLEKMMLVGSILMPPLYIGKTNNLNIRCRQHRTNNDVNENNFHNRFEQFAKNKKLNNQEKFLTQRVEDLIFVCITTDSLESGENTSTEAEELLEEIFKLFAKPPYGKN